MFSSLAAWRRGVAQRAVHAGWDWVQRTGAVTARRPGRLRFGAIGEGTRLAFPQGTVFGAPWILGVFGAGYADVKPGATEDAFWAVRKLLEHLARDHPVVLVFDDIHWGEPTFLDLIEHLADWTRDAAVLVLCIARPELLEVRPGWGGGKPNATTVSAPDVPQAVAEITRDIVPRAIERVALLDALGRVLAQDAVATMIAILGTGGGLPAVFGAVIVASLIGYPETDTRPGHWRRFHAYE